MNNNVEEKKVMVVGNVNLEKNKIMIVGRYEI